MTEHVDELCKFKECAICNAARRGNETVNRKYTLDPDRPEKVKRPSYRSALYWIVMNDDVSFLNYNDRSDGRSAMSATACLVADMFDLSDERVRADLIREARRLDRL
jgi:hypothetical protein